VGTIDRSRHPDLRAVFLVGLNEGIFPRAGAEDPMFNDRERRKLAEGGFTLAPTREQQLYNERFLGYIAFTRAKEYLWVSCPVADESGKKLNPSVFIGQLCKCLPQLETHRVASTDWRRETASVWNRSQLAAGVAMTFRHSRDGKEIDTWAELYNSCIAGRPADRKTRAILSSLFYSNQSKPLPAGLMEKFHPGKKIIGSVSRFETYAACPFKYFARYILGLEEREEYRISALDLGTLYHAILKRVMGELIESGRGPADATQDEIERLVDAAVDELAPELKNEILLSDGRSRYLREDARRTIKRMMAAVREQARATEFKPKACELSFGRDRDDVGPLRLSLEGGYTAEIVGRVDRADIAPASSGEALLKVVDYKTGHSGVSLAEVVSGLHLQLPVYLLAVAAGGKSRFGAELHPVAGFLAPIRGRISSLRDLADISDEDVAREKEIREYRNRGLFSDKCVRELDSTVVPGKWSRYFSFNVTKDGALGSVTRGDALPHDLFEKLLKRTARHAADICNDIGKGRFPITPYRMGNASPCGMCEYASFCRFDPGPNKYREIAVTTKVQALKELGWRPEEKPKKTRSAPRRSKRRR